MPQIFDACNLQKNNRYNSVHFAQGVKLYFYYGWRWCLYFFIFSFGN